MDKAMVKYCIKIEKKRMNIVADRNRSQRMLYLFAEPRQHSKFTAR